MEYCVVKFIFFAKFAYKEMENWSFEEGVATFISIDYSVFFFGNNLAS
jgi:hypothetical protein